MTIIYLLRGNTMATKNLIVHTLWIIQMYEIPRAKPPIQNCLGYLFRERVGIRNEVRKNLILSHFSRFKVQNDTILIL